MLTPDKPLVVAENFFSETEYKLIKRRAERDELSYTPHVARTRTASKDILYDTGFATIWYVDALDKDGHKNENKHPVITELLHTKIEEYFHVNRLLRIRLGTFIPVGKTMVHDPHVDFGFPHITALLYTCTEEDAGHTYFWNEFYDPFMYKSLEEQMQLNADKFTFDKAIKIPPKENTVVFFLGDMFHASSVPETIMRRTAVNINFEGVPRYGNA